MQPDYAAAWSGLAGAYIISAVSGNAPPSYFAPLAEEAASRALELDDSLPDDYSALGGIALLFRWNPEQSLKQLDRAIALDPQWDEAYYERSLALEALNRMDEALDAGKRSAALDPFGRPFSVPQVLFRMRNYDAAIREARLRLGAQPNDYGLHWGLSEAYQCKGLEEEAAREYDKATLLGDGEAEAAAVEHAFKRGGWPAILQKQLSDLKKKAAAHQYVSPLDLPGRMPTWGGKTRRCTLRMRLTRSVRRPWSGYRTGRSGTFFILTSGTGRSSDEWVCRRRGDDPRDGKPESHGWARRRLVQRPYRLSILASRDFFLP